MGKSIIIKKANFFNNAIWDYEKEGSLNGEQFAISTGINLFDKQAYKVYAKVKNIDFGVSSHFGFYTFSLAILCFFIGYIVENFFNLSLIFFLIVSVIAVPVLISLNFVFTYIVLGYSDYITYYVNHIVPVMIYTFIVSPIFYGINKVIHNKFSVVK